MMLSKAHSESSYLLALHLRYFKPRSRTRTGAKKKKTFVVAHPHTPPILSASPSSLLDAASAGRAGVPRRNQQPKCLNRRGLDSHTVVTEP